MADNLYGGETPGANATTGGSPGMMGGFGQEPGQRSRTKLEQKLDERVSTPHEGSLTSRIEYQTAKAPSMSWLVAAGCSMAASIGLFAMRRPLTAIFVGLWPPTFLLFGTYNKLVKLANEERI